MTCEHEFLSGLFVGALGSFVGCTIIYILTLRGNRGP
jgi:hypothetical protein